MNDESRTTANKNRAEEDYSHHTSSQLEFGVQSNGDEDCNPKGEYNGHGDNRRGVELGRRDGQLKEIVNESGEIEPLSRNSHSAGEQNVFLLPIVHSYSSEPEGLGSPFAAPCAKEGDATAKGEETRRDVNPLEEYPVVERNYDEAEEDVTVGRGRWIEAGAVEIEAAGDPHFLTGSSKRARSPGTSAPGLGAGSPRAEYNPCGDSDSQDDHNTIREGDILAFSSSQGIAQPLKRRRGRRMRVQPPRPQSTMTTYSDTLPKVDQEEDLRVLRDAVPAVTNNVVPSGSIPSSGPTQDVVSAPVPYLRRRGRPRGRGRRGRGGLHPTMSVDGDGDRAERVAREGEMLVKQEIGVGDEARRMVAVGRGRGRRRGGRSGRGRKGSTADTESLPQDTSSDSGEDEWPSGEESTRPSAGKACPRDGVG